MTEADMIMAELAQVVDAAADRIVAKMFPQWYALQIHGRQEKSVVTRLTEKGFDLYVPLVTELHRWSDRRKRIEVPLFPGYAFIYTSVTDSMKRTVLRTPGVAALVSSQGQPLPIPDTQIENVQKLLEQSAPLHPHVFTNAGKRMRIIGGALDGLEGILVGTKPDWSLVISVELIRRSIALSLTGYDVEPA